MLAEINYIECDIVLGHLFSDTLEENKQPIMAHPPLNKSDITLNEFMRQIKSHNANVPKDDRKGVKLDFKSIEVFTQSLDILNEFFTSDYDIWINADIYSGPVNSTGTPVDADTFLTEAKKFETATLSTGWTTRWGSDFTEGSYTRDQVNEMINGLKKNDVKNPITFPVRAGIAANSIEELKHLYDSLKNSNHVTFTIWSSASDYVDVEGLRKMIFSFGIDKVYIDVPDALFNQLDLSNDPYDNGVSGVKKFNVVPIALLLSALVLLFK
jgi:hypothetical protein